MARRALAALGADADALRAEAARRAKGDADAADAAAAAAGAKRRRERDGPKALEEFCRDLCAEARAGRIDPVVGRESEVARVVQILARRTKNNPILLGEPGVGKTAIAEGLARAIVGEAAATLDGAPLPAFLKGKRVLQLDVSIVLGWGMRGRGDGIGGVAWGKRQRQAAAATAHPTHAPPPH